MRQDGRAQFIGGDTSALSYHYVHVTGKATEADPNKSIIKIPQLPVKDQNAFLHSTFD